MPKLKKRIAGLDEAALVREHSLQDAMDGALGWPLERTLEL